MEVAWYRIGDAPVGPMDGTFAVGDDLTAFAGLSVGSDGEHSVYVWLEDALGQRYHST